MRQVFGVRPLPEFSLYPHQSRAADVRQFRGKYCRHLLSSEFQLDHEPDRRRDSYLIRRKDLP